MGRARTPLAGPLHRLQANRAMVYSVQLETIVASRRCVHVFFEVTTPNLWHPLHVALCCLQSSFLAACGFTGSLLGGQVAAQSATDESSLRDSMKSFTDVYALVEANYANKLNTDQVDKAIYDGAIPGMLHVLDPHSNFYDPKSYAQMREDQRGKYYGVGMRIQPQNSKIVVVAPMEGTPAYRAGIRPGDVILSVDGKSTESMDSAAVATMLKGPRGTHVSVTMGREGSSKPLVFDLMRDEIPQYSVDSAFMIRPGIGYIHITNFMETTSREVQAALDKFGPNLQGLLIDLRGNPGGLLNEAVNISDKFLQKGQIVVSQRARKGVFPDQVYTAPSGSDAKYPIVILVNRNTASAAEIVSGALQDHDRALIVGETTFGKGLVQTVEPMPENSALALTTYHYYTPSGPPHPAQLQQRFALRLLLRPQRRAAGKRHQQGSEAHRLRPHRLRRRRHYAGREDPRAEEQPLRRHHADPLCVLRLQQALRRDPHRREEPRGRRRAAPAVQGLPQGPEGRLHRQGVRGQCRLGKGPHQAGTLHLAVRQVLGNQVITEWDPQIAKALTFMPEAQALENHTLPSQQKTQTARNQTGGK